jgi:hypothetical protein
MLSAIATLSARPAIRPVKSYDELQELFEVRRVVRMDGNGNGGIDEDEGGASEKNGGGLPVAMDVKMPVTSSKAWAPGTMRMYVVITVSTVRQNWPQYQAH